MQPHATDDLSQDVVFDLLSNRRRRFIISYLYEHGPTTLMTFATEIAAWEDGVDVDQVTDEQRKRAYVSIYQTHVPRLDDSGVVTYDPESGLIELTDRAEQVVRFLPTDGSDDPPWPVIYMLVALAGLVVYTLGVFGVMSMEISGLLIVGGVFGTAVVHLLYTRRPRNGTSLNMLVRQDEIT